MYIYIVVYAMHKSKYVAAHFRCEEHKHFDEAKQSYVTFRNTNIQLLNLLRVLNDFTY